MNSEQIADNVKRLRELDSKPRENFTATVKEYWDDKKVDSFHNVMQCAASYREAIQTINALVDLVGEMAEAIANNGDISWIDTKLMLNFAAVAALKEKV